MIRSFCIISVIIASLFVNKKEQPTVYIIGDSTVRNTNRPQAGWGEMFNEFVDTSSIHISNQAMAGRSTRTFIKEGRWEKVLSTLKAGDFVIMQFGHNEGSKPDTSKAGYRGVLRGTGDSTVQLTWPDGKMETVHTYGWYLRKFVQEAKAKGAIPVICSMIPRNRFKDGKVQRADQTFGKWAQEIAASEHVSFIDLNNLTAVKYERLGPDSVKNLFFKDDTHTNIEGARINAASVKDGIQLLPELELNKYLK